jgi:beta-lactamase regulating signal transducer with metallopeptidase domain
MNVALQNLEWIFGCLFTASWEASVLALVVLGIQGIFGARLNPRWRHALWLLVILRLILPVLPESALSLFQFAPPAPTALAVKVTAPLFDAPPPLLLPSMPETHAEVLAPAHPFSAYSLLSVVWLTGALILLILTVIVNQRFARLVAASPEILDAELLCLFDEVKTEFGTHRRIRLIESSQVQSPAIMGLFQPTLLLPVDIRTEFETRELRFIFLHELAHLKRGDLIVQALIAVLQMLHWFNPVLWFAFRRMRIDREPATDALVLSHAGEGEKERYGLMLIKLLDHFNQRHSLATLVGILEDKDQFKRRFSLIAKFTRGAYGWSLLGVVCLIVLSVTCLTSRKSAADEISLAAEKARPPAIYVFYPKLGVGFFGPISHEFSLSDQSHIPGTDHTLSVWCQSFTETGVTLEFVESWPTGSSSTVPGGAVAEPIAEKRTQKAVPIGSTASFRIFDSIDVMTSPTPLPVALAKSITSGPQAQLPAAGRKGDAATEQKAIRAGMATIAPGTMEAGAYAAVHGATNPAVAVMPVVLGASMVYKLPAMVAFDSTPGGNPALDQELIDVVRDGRTDKVGKGDVDKVRNLLGEGASANAKDGQGTSALTWALNFGKDDAAQALIRDGADGRAQDANGEDAAWLAAKIYYCPGALDLLLKEGVDFRGLNKQGRTILVAMMQVGAPQAGKMNYLRDRVWTADEFKAYEARERRTIELLIAMGADFNGNDGSTTPLMAAAQSGHAEAVRVLLEHGANASFKDANGQTALDLAKAFHPELVPLFAGNNPSPAKAGVDEPAADPAPREIGAEDLAGMQKDLLAASEDADARQVLLESVKNLPDDKFLATLAALDRTSLTIVSVQNDMANKNAAIEALLKSGFTEDHPRVQAARAEWAVKEAQLKELVAGTRRAMAIDLQMADSRVALLSKEVNDAKGGAVAPSTENAGGSNASGDKIEVSCQVAEVKEDVYLANRKKIDAVVKKADLAFLVNLKGVSLLSEPSVTTRSGLKATIEVTQELSFPQNFEKGADGKFVPTNFAQRDCGVTATLTPVEMNGKVQVSGKLSLTTFEGFNFNGDSDTRWGSPTFRTTESYIFEEMENGDQIRVVMIPGIQNELPTRAQLMGTASQAQAAEGTQNRLIVFLGAKRVEER